MRLIAPQKLILFVFLSAAFLFAASCFLSAQAPTAPGKPLPPGPMQAKIKSTCTQCHNTGRITEQHLTREQWVKELKKMEGLGANIPQTDRSAILSYLVRNFGPSKAAGNAEVKKSGN